ncbi:unnamed protein product [Cylicocyclus nassatus]|uniref:WAP domain-containing protein n=1 Tax=Cylicocyclus nassatus TaxID=53992 RepID=A0AA36DP87_CYLNA|nr:unnamed protein product [Cylicocyclus nassatus]
MYLIAVLVLFTEGAMQRLTLCEYFRLLGRTNLNCAAPRLSGQSMELHSFRTVTTSTIPSSTTESKLAKMIAIIEERLEKKTAPDKKPAPRSRWLLCETQEYRDCKADKESCLSGYSCRSLSTASGRCCVSSTAKVKLPKIPIKCPPPEELGYTCTFGSKRVPTSWCLSDSDCSGAPVRLCCSTGCGFNACIPPSGHVIDIGIRSIENEHCPPNYLLNVRCRMNSFQVTSWCNTDEECQGISASKVSHFCCPTPCGYNTCVSSNGYETYFG